MSKRFSIQIFTEFYISKRLDKNNIQYYIGGNTLMEIGFAHVLNQKIFLYNPIPEIPYYKSEIEAVKPIIINGDLKQIK